MKKILILTMLLLIGTTSMLYAGNGSRNTVNEQIGRKVQKEYLNKKQDEAHAFALDALKAGHFVLQADKIINVIGIEEEVDSVANFVAMRGFIGCVQLAYLVENTPCGITMEGAVGQVEMNADKKGNTVCTFSIDSPERTMILRVTLSKKGDEAWAEVSACEHVKGIVFHGRLLYGPDAEIITGMPS